MDNLIRVISKDGSVVASVIDSTGIASTIERLHRTSAVTTAALGRLCTAAALMGAQLKGEKQSITLRINGGGPAGSVIAVADSKGNVKGYISDASVELPSNQYGKLDVGGAVGQDGYLDVVRDNGTGEPYTGRVALVSGEIAEDITHYYATSEQTPTVCGLGVLVNPDLTVNSAGGFLVQLLPFCDETVIDIIEKNIEKLPAVSGMFADYTPQQVAELLLDGLEPDILDTQTAEYRCDCSRERVERAVISIGKEGIQSLIDDEQTTEVDCHFCNKKYRFSKEELRGLLNI